MAIPLCHPPALVTGAKGVEGGGACHLVCRLGIPSAAWFGAFSKLVTPALFGMGLSPCLDWRQDELSQMLILNEELHSKASLYGAGDSVVQGTLWLS